MCPTLASRFTYRIYEIPSILLGRRFSTIAALGGIHVGWPLMVYGCFGARPLGSGATALWCQASDLFRFSSVFPDRCPFSLHHGQDVMSQL